MIATETCVAEHPALRAWSEISGFHSASTSVELLKDRSESQVYRLAGLGPEGAAVIAKRYPEPKALCERMIYDRVLRCLPMVSLRHHGLINEKGTGFCWAFFEDAAGEPYSPAIEQHAVAAAVWLAALHTTGETVAQTVRLPDRSPHHYFECLQSGRDRIRRSLASALLEESDRTVLAAVADQCDAVEAKWEWIEGLCGRTPKTFVHGDLYSANIQMRARPGGVTMVAFDWESAGCGVPAIDLALAGLNLDSYCSITSKVWPHVKLQVVRALSNAGKIFQLLELVDWESKGLGSEWLRRPMKHMRCYNDELSRAIEAAGFE
jgi:phosphotransferase family enzyme